MAISIRLPSDVEARLQNWVALTGRSKTHVLAERNQMPSCLNKSDGVEA